MGLDGGGDDPGGGPADGLAVQEVGASTRGGSGWGRRPGHGRVEGDACLGGAILREGVAGASGFGTDGERYV